MFRIEKEEVKACLHLGSCSRAPGWHSRTYNTFERTIPTIQYLDDESPTLISATVLV